MPRVRYLSNYIGKLICIVQRAAAPDFGCREMLFVYVMIEGFHLTMRKREHTSQNQP